MSILHLKVLYTALKLMISKIYISTVVLNNFDLHLDVTYYTVTLLYS